MFWSSEFVQFFTIFQLIISCEIALAYHYYYLKNDKKINTTDLTEILGKNIDRLVIDFMTTYYIFSIEFTYESELPYTLKFSFLC